MVNLLPSCRCKCNGHASDCRTLDINDLYSQLICVCEHNTTGVNCERCHDLYNDQKYEVATFEDAHECQRKYYLFVLTKRWYCGVVIETN